MLTPRMILILIVLFFIPALAVSQIPLVDTKAGKAFKAKDYRKALVEFNKLLEVNPDSTLILRYIGITYHKLGKYDKAIEYFEKALEIDPDNVSVYYYVATTYFKISNAIKAREYFLKVIKLAPDSLYAKWASKYIQAMDQQSTVFERPGGPRLWNIYLQFAPQLDFNVPDNPSRDGTIDDNESFRFTEYLLFGVESRRIGNWMFGADFSSYQSQQTKSDLTEFNLSTFDVGGFINYTNTLLGKPFSPNLSYTFNYVLLDYDGYSNSHIIRLSLNTAFTQNTLTVPFYEISFDSFNDEGFDPAISSRDAINNAVGIKQYFFFLERNINLWAGYEFQNNNADGLNFNLNAHKISGGFSVPIVWEIRGDVTVSYTWEDYSDFQGPIDRENNRQNYVLRVTRKIKEPVYISFSYGFINDNSNYEVLEYDRHILSWSLFLNY